MTIQAKATEQYFPVVLFVMPNVRALTVESIWMKSLSVTIEIMHALEQFLW